MSKTIIALLTVAVITSCGSKQKLSQKETSNLLTIENDHLKVGILAKTGGRMVYFGQPDGENILLTNEEQWFEPDTVRMVASPFADFKAYNGWITWVGPQSQWWINQDVNPERKDRAAIWPPDPFLIYGEYTITKQTNNHLTIIGPKSPVSGVQLTKSFTLLRDSLIIKVTAKNIRTKPVSCDLWSNARFAPTSDFCIPAKEEEVKRIEYRENTEKLQHVMNNGCFSFIAQAPLELQERVAKAFIQASAGEIHLFHQKEKLTIKFASVEEALIHPEHALVEVFLTISQNGTDGLLELEHHSAYRTLQPGETMTMEEVWILKGI